MVAAAGLWGGGGGWVRKEPLVGFDDTMCGGGGMRWKENETVYFAVGGKECITMMSCSFGEVCESISQCGTRTTGNSKWPLTPELLV